MEALMQHVAQQMRQNGFEVFEAETGAQAREYLLERIGSGKSVGVGGSVSVREIEVLPALEAQGCKVYSGWNAKLEDVPMIRRESRVADVYLSSANAVTKTGKLVLVDGIGNRVGAVCDGPKELFFVVSHSKVVDGGINTAIARIKKTACPQNARRLGLKTSCALTGKCSADCPQSMCRLTLVVDRPPRNRKVTVVFVEEALGY